MNERGLAQAMSAPSQVSVRQVVQMLMQGAEPEELVQMGIPEEMVTQAIRALMQQMQAQQPAQQEGGLAAMATPPTGI